MVIFLESTLTLRLCFLHDNVNTMLYKICTVAHSAHNRTAPEGYVHTNSV